MARLPSYLFLVSGLLYLGITSILLISTNNMLMGSTQGMMYVTYFILGNVMISKGYFPQDLVEEEA